MGSGSTPGADPAEGAHNRMPDAVRDGAARHVHLIAICGVAMSALAGMLKQRGYVVSGSDENVYPPMSTQLERWGIEVMTPYRPENLERAQPDLVVVGNVVRMVNPEATAMRERGLRHVSFPQALGDLFIAPRHGVVVVGTHGKTTATAMIDRKSVV